MTSQPAGRFGGTGVVVTRGAHGIGRACAIRLAAEGALVAVADLDLNGIEASSRVVSARPADAILAVADEVGADLIVVGTVGESPISGALLGSVVLKLVQRSPLPMLIVPAPA